MLWRAVLLMMLLLRPAWAQEIAGSSDPGFQAALAAWLAEDEALALPQLAGLASGGNQAAQVLLGLIDKGASLQGPFLSGLSRAERVALMRAPGGISGRNWLRVAAMDVPLARLWATLLEADAPPGIVLDFARAGEGRAARMAVLALRARQDRGLAGVAAGPDFPPAMLFALWEAALPGTGLDALQPRMAEQARALPPGDPQREMAGLFDDPGYRAEWFASAPVAEPIDALCTALCPETHDTCAEAALIAVGGYRGLTALGSPVEALVDTPTYSASAKGQSDLLRRALLRLPNGARARFIGRATGWDACFGAALQAEADRFE